MTYRFTSTSNDPAVAAREACDVASARSEPVELKFNGSTEWDSAPKTVTTVVKPGSDSAEIARDLAEKIDRG